MQAQPDSQALAKASNMSIPEYFDVVDERDIVIDKKSRSDCLDQGLLHRAILVFLTNPNGEVYIQKRASNLLFYPGYWSASVTGHVSAGETYTQAAKREVKEELGINCELTEICKFQTPKWKIGDKIEWEFITVFESTCASAITLSDESEGGRFVSKEEFKQLVTAKPETFTPDTLLALQYYPAKTAEPRQSLH